MLKNEQALNTLKNIIGADLFMEVCQRMPGCDLRIPGNGSGFTSRAERNAAIWRDIYGGLDIAAAAAKYGLSASHIYKILESRK